MSRMAEQQLYINGGYTSATSGRTFETINPKISFETTRERKD